MVDFKRMLDNIYKKAIWKSEIFTKCSNKYKSKGGILCKLLDDKSRSVDKRCGFYNCKKIKDE